MKVGADIHFCEISCLYLLAHPSLPSLPPSLPLDGSTHPGVVKGAVNDFVEAHNSTLWHIKSHLFPLAPSPPSLPPSP